MKYVVLIYSNPATWEACRRKTPTAVIRDHWDVIDELTKSGELLNQFGLADPSSTKTMRDHDGVPAVTDGPFGEAKEQLAGVFLVDCESIERVIEFSGRSPSTAIVEVRPLMDETPARRCDDSTPPRGPAARARAAGPRRARAALRPLRRRARTRSRRRCWPPRPQWPDEGIPDNPRGWLITVASRRLTDEIRGEHGPTPSRGRRSRRCVAARGAARAAAGRRPRRRAGRHADAALPVLPPGALAGVAGGADAARRRRADDGPDRPAFLVPEATMAQRISRAKATIKAAGARSACRPRTSARSGCASCSTCCT